MNPTKAQTALAKARGEFEKSEVQARESERRLVAAGEMARLAKTKFKQARKWARHTKKLLKRAEDDVTAKLRALEKTVAQLKKIERKALKKLKKASAKTASKTGKKTKPVKVKKPAAKKAKSSSPKKPKVVKLARAKKPHSESRPEQIAPAAVEASLPPPDLSAASPAAPEPAQA